jgi:hypothetical protein
MTKRYVAVHRIAWGKNYVLPGEELRDPVPHSESPLLKIHIQRGEVREEEQQKQAGYRTKDMAQEQATPTRAAGTYARRDMVAEERSERPRAPRRQIEEQEKPKPAATGEAHDVGALTSKNTNVSEKPE